MPKSDYLNSSYLSDLKDRLSLKPPRGRMASIGQGVPPYMYPDTYVSKYGESKVDERDAWIIRSNMMSLFESNEPHEGEYVIFADGTLSRVAYVWRFCDDKNTHCRDHNHTAERVQTAPGGSFHLGDGYVSMSGSLNDAVPYSTFTLTNELRLGSAWIAHHNFLQASCSVSCLISFRVWHSTSMPPRF